MDRETFESVACNLCGGSGTRTLFTEGPFSIVRCLRCGLIYVNPRLRREDLITEYGAAYHAYADEVSSAKERLAEELLEELCRLRAPGRFLEVGPGSGILLEQADRQGWDVTGLEASPHAIGRVSERVRDRVLTGTFEAQEFPAGSFDAIVMCDVLEHMPDPVAALRKTAGILAEDGVLLVTTPNARTPNFFLKGQSARVILPREHLYYFTTRTLGNLLRKSGFVPVRMHTYGHNLAGIPEDIGRRAGVRVSLQKVLVKPGTFSPRRTLVRGVTYPYYRMLSWVWKNAVIPLAQCGQTIRVIARRG